MKISWDEVSALKHGIQVARDKAVEEKAKGTAIHLNGVIQYLNELVYDSDND